MKPWFTVTCMTELGTFDEKVERWIKDLDANIGLGEHYVDDLKMYMEKTLKEIEDISMSDAKEAYGKLIRLAGVGSHAAGRKHELVELFGHYVDHFSKIMEKVRIALGAASYTISVSFPFDMGISLTFGPDGNS